MDKKFYYAYLLLHDSYIMNMLATNAQNTSKQKEKVANFIMACEKIQREVLPAGMATLVGYTSVSRQDTRQGRRP